MTTMWNKLKGETNQPTNQQTNKAKQQTGGNCLWNTQTDTPSPNNSLRTRDVFTVKKQKKISDGTANKIDLRIYRWSAFYFIDDTCFDASDVCSFFFFVRVCVIMEIQFYQFRPLFLDGFPTPHPYPSRPFPLVCVRVAIVFFNISTTVPIVFCFLFFSAAAFCSSSLLKFRLTNHVGERASTKQNKTHTTKTKRASKDEHEVRVCVCVAVLCPSPAPRPPRPPPILSLHVALVSEWNRTPVFRH